MPTARAVADALRPFDNTLDPQRLAEQASSSKQPLSLITLRQSDHDRVAAAIGALPGVVITPQAELLPTDDDVRAGHHRARSRRRWSTNSTARPAGGWSASTRTASTSTCSTRCRAQPAPSVTISLDRSVQNAAQNAVNTAGNQAMIVVIKPSTGEILAVAQNAAADARRARSPPPACTRPGRRSRSSPPARPSNATWPRPTRCCGCPGVMDIGHRTMPNYGGFDLGTVPMSRAFASSCNTTFAELASRMPPRGLTMAAAQIRHRAGLPDRRASPP